MHIKAGTRGSRLAVIQTSDALERLAQLFPSLDFEMVTVETPGDRDLTCDLKESPPDFFTRDLDDAVRSGRIDIAVHSAKDLPDPVPEGLDWFWLPWREDPRDAWVLAQGRSMAELPQNPVVGVSSARRDACALRRFPGARLRSIRGSIVQRMEQLDRGEYDAVLMAGAALNRLNLQERITEWIPLEELDVPAGQGYLAVTFAAGNASIRMLRRCFVKAVRFVGAGVGSADYCTLGGVKDVQCADVCLYDVLMDEAILNHLPQGAERVFVGKRCGAHSRGQSETTALIADYARQGKRVVRLKGGDPGLFGRLAEESVLLDALDLPYHVRAGVSALTVATTGTGLLLTRRGVSRGFCAMTPRAARGEVAGIAREVREKLPLVLFMSVAVAPAMARQLLAEGWHAATPAAVVFNAGADDQRVCSFTLAALCAEPAELDESAPGLLVVGCAAESLFKERRGVLRGGRVLLTCSEGIMEKAVRAVTDLGGVPIVRPMIRLVPCGEIAGRLAKLADYQWIVLTSPASAGIFMRQLLEAGADLRRLPRIMSCGPGTAQALREYGVYPDLTPPVLYSAAGLAEALRELDLRGARILRLRSAIAGALLADVLRDKGAAVDDEILYRNEFITYPAIPAFDIVFFASASAADAYLAQAGADSLHGKFTLAIGGPTAQALEKRGIVCDCIAGKATVEGAFETLAHRFTARNLAESV